MVRRTWLVVVLFAPTVGCANLKVSKVALDKRLEGSDHCVQGFRYYLSRPYAVVHKPILISEQKTLAVAVRGESPGSPAAAVRFLDGPRRGQTVALEDLKVSKPGDRHVQAVTTEELQAMRQSVAATLPPAPTTASKAGRPSPDAPRDDVRRTQLTDADAQAQAAMDAAQTAAPATGNLTTPPFANFTAFKPEGDRASAAIRGESAIEIVFLPDMDEQYAVKSRNWLSKTTFGLVFQDGWGLKDVSAEHDSTPVAIALLDTIDSAINAAKTLGIAALPGAGGTGGGGTAKSVETAEIDRSSLPQGDLMFVYERLYIKPGVYRLNKPWEMDQPAQPVGCGLLAKLGLTTVREIKIVTYAQDQAEVFQEDYFIR